MKSLVIYTSQTGFTKRYAGWLAERLKCEAMDFEQAKAKDLSFFDTYDALVFGGWARAGKIHHSEWFIEHLENWKGKKLALFMVGASPNASPDIPGALDMVLKAEQKALAKVFYCQGGLDYEKMSLPSKIVMKLVAAAMKKKNPQAGEMVSKSYDIADPKYLDPIVDYLKE